jgi:hypothetical protein
MKPEMRWANKDKMIRDLTRTKDSRKQEININHTQSRNKRKAQMNILGTGAVGANVGVQGAAEVGTYVGKGEAVVGAAEVGAYVGKGEAVVGAAVGAMDGEGSAPVAASWKAINERKAKSMMTTSIN